MIKDVQIWLSAFETEAPFAIYIEERWGGAGEELDREKTPLNQLIADQGEQFYDHDWFEAISVFNKKTTTKPLLRKLSFSEAFIEDAAKSVRKLKVSSVNSAIMISAKEVKKPVSVTGSGFTLTY